ncbi:hypothetical protein SLEP1_g2867 [Rubroshorea leprosula]|uniref:Nuclear transcription factor Y subunit n=1 Tax=Rubroshorea leprosula TaxID=152421 RepID=A0AAV5HUD8_9ROSI|nr:hypothetical protein SLEP1_g2867 [Rubroshorea leprosula]
MPAKPANGDQQLVRGARTVLQSTAYSEPWWRGVGTNATLGEAASKSTSVEQPHGAVATGASHLQSNAGGRHGKEHEHIKHVSSSAPLTLGEHLEPNSQMELVGHSIVLTTYPYADSPYSGILTSYGSQTMVPQQLYGMHHARMPLPLQMEEEPVYVNAKQYHGILRRREIRAKAVLDKKAVKVRKPYLHESRHLHAMKRARGCGGRFLNTKKLNSDVANPTSEKCMNADENLSSGSANLSLSERLGTNGTGNLKSSGDHQEGNESVIQDGHKAHTLSHGHTNGHAMSSIYRSSSNDCKQGKFFGQQREVIQGNGAARGAPLH